MKQNVPFLTGEQDYVVGVLVIPGRGANLEKPGRLEKHGRLKTWTIFHAGKTWTTWTITFKFDFNKSWTISLH